MNLESIVKYFSPKSMTPGAVPCGITAETLTITDVMASLGLVTAKAAVGIELYLAKAGVLPMDNIVGHIEQLATDRASRNRALKKMAAHQRRIFLRTLAEFVFRDYSLSAASTIKCDRCAGAGLIDAEVFVMKSHRTMKLPQWAKDLRQSPGDFEVKRQVRETVRVICKPCDGKGRTRNECRCRGRGEVLDKKKSELQGVPVYKKCPRCSGRGYPRLKDTEIFKALGIPETTWRRNYKLFFERLVEYCYVEESSAEKALERVTR